MNFETIKRPCWSCPFMTKEPYEDFFGDDTRIIGEFFFCTKKEEFLISPITSKKGNLITEDAIDMPLVCGHQLKHQLGWDNVCNRLASDEEVKNFNQISDENEELAEQLLESFKQRKQ